MKKTGIVRKIDHVGRFSIPIEIRKVLNIPVDTPLEFFVSKDRLILRKLERVCVICGNPYRLTKFRDKPVCYECGGEIRRDMNGGGAQEES